MAKGWLALISHSLRARSQSSPIQPVCVDNEAVAMANIQELSQQLDTSVRVLKVMQGSGPFGEVSRDSRIYTVERHPPQLDLALSKDVMAPHRTDIDIGPGGLAFRIDDCLSRDEADALAAVSERIGYSKFAPAIRTPPGMRQNKASHWIASTSVAEAFFAAAFRTHQPFVASGD
jgi:hypothetical protein